MRASIGSRLVPSRARISATSPGARPTQPQAKRMRRAIKRRRRIIVGCLQHEIVLKANVLGQWCERCSVRPWERLRAPSPSVASACRDGQANSRPSKPANAAGGGGFRIQGAELATRFDSAQSSFILGQRPQVEQRIIEDAFRTRRMGLANRATANDKLCNSAIINGNSSGEVSELNLGVVNYDHSFALPSHLIIGIVGPNNALDASCLLICEPQTLHAPSHPYDDNWLARSNKSNRRSAMRTKPNNQQGIFLSFSVKAATASSD